MEKSPPFDCGRRSFLKASAAVASTILLPTWMLASPYAAIADNAEVEESQDIATQALAPDGNIGFWDLPRTLWLRRGGSDQRITYWADGKLDFNEYARACYLLMDVRANQAVQMDVQLLNLMRAIQGWLEYYNIRAPIVINSGYRTQRTNGALEGAARNSMHLYGKAADIRMPGIPIEYLGRLSSYFSAGGVGFYMDKGFIHIDTGRVRRWISR